MKGAKGSPTKQDYAYALSLACSYLMNVYGEEWCRREVARSRAGQLGRVYPHEALLADELERAVMAGRALA